VKSNEKQNVKFQLGFYKNGIYEVGRVADDLLLKMNLLEATMSSPPQSSNLSSNSSSLSNPIYYDDNKDDFIFKESNDSQMEGGTVFIYLKDQNGKYEYFKKLNVFTVSILNP
jgi:hypothetical protein